MNVIIAVSDRPLLRQLIKLLRLQIRLLVFEDSAVIRANLDLRLVNASNLANLIL